MIVKFVWSPEPRSIIDVKKVDEIPEEEIVVRNELWSSTRLLSGEEYTLYVHYEEYMATYNIDYDVLDMKEAYRKFMIKEYIEKL